MHIEIGFVSDNDPLALQDYIERQIGVTLAGRHGLFESVDVGVFETGDTAAKVTCRIQLKLRPSGICVIQESRDADAYAAIDRAMQGIARLPNVNRSGNSLMNGRTSIPA